MRFRSSPPGASLAVGLRPRPPVCVSGAVAPATRGWRRPVMPTRRGVSWKHTPPGGEGGHGEKFRPALKTTGPRDPFHQRPTRFFLQERNSAIRNFTTLQPRRDHSELLSIFTCLLVSCHYASSGSERFQDFVIHRSDFDFFKKMTLYFESSLGSQQNERKVQNPHMPTLPHQMVHLLQPAKHADLSPSPRVHGLCWGHSWCSALCGVDRCLKTCSTP